MLLELAEPVDARLTWPRCPGAGSTRRSSGRRMARVWRTTRMPAGPATCRIAQVSPCHVRVDAWGPGACAGARAATPDLLGARDDLSGFTPRHELVRTAHRRHRRVADGPHRPGAGGPRPRRARAAGDPAHRARRVALAARPPRGGGARSSPAGHAGAPDARGWLEIPSWDFHRAGVDPRRARTVRECASVAARLEEASTLEPALARARLRLVPGVGVWTAARPPSARSATPTRSRWATTTSPTTWAGRSRASGSTTSGCSSSSSRSAPTASAWCACCCCQAPLARHGAARGSRSRTTAATEPPRRRLRHDRATAPPGWGGVTVWAAGSSPGALSRVRASRGGPSPAGAWPSAPSARCPRSSRPSAAASSGGS